MTAAEHKYIVLEQELLATRAAAFGYSRGLLRLWLLLLPGQQLNLGADNMPNTYLATQPRSFAASNLLDQALAMFPFQLGAYARAVQCC